MSGARGKLHRWPLQAPRPAALPRAGDPKVVAEAFDVPEAEVARYYRHVPMREIRPDPLYAEMAIFLDRPISRRPTRPGCGDAGQPVAGTGRGGGGT